MRLIVVRGPSPAGPFELREGDNAAGRAPECEIFLPSKRVSRNHAVFTVRGSTVEVQDLGSHNGLLAGNGQRVRTLPLAPGERVQVGDYLLLLEGTPASDELDLEEDDLLLDEDTAESAGGPAGPVASPAPRAVPAPPKSPAAPAAPAPRPAPPASKPSAAAPSTRPGPVAPPAGSPGHAAVPRPSGNPTPLPDIASQKPAAPAQKPAAAPTPAPPGAPASPSRPPAPGPRATAPNAATAPAPSAPPKSPVPLPAAPEVPRSPAAAPAVAPQPPSPTPIPPPPVLPFAPSGGFGGPRRAVPDPSRSVFLEPEEIDLDDPPAPVWRAAPPDAETASVITRAPVGAPDADTSVSGPRDAPAPPWPTAAPADAAPPAWQPAAEPSPSPPPPWRPGADEGPPPWRPAAPEAEATVATPTPAAPAWQSGAADAEPPPPWLPPRGDHDTSSAIRPSPMAAAPLPFGPPTGGFAAPPPEPTRPAPLPAPSPPSKPASSPIGALEPSPPPPPPAAPRRAAPPVPGEVARGSGFPWLVQATFLVLFVMGLFLCAPVGGVFWQVSAQGERLESLSLLRGAALAESLANRNAQPLAEQRGLALDTAFLLDRAGVRSALIADRTGTVMAPTEKLRTSVAVVPVFVESARTGELATLPTSDGLYQIVAPIRGQINGSGPRQIVGFALIEYDPAAVTEDLGSPLVGAVAGLIVAVFAAGALGAGGWWLVLRPLAALREETELALLGDSPQVTSPLRLPQMEALVHSINRAVTRAHGGAPRGR